MKKFFANILLASFAVIYLSPVTFAASGTISSKTPVVVKTNTLITTQQVKAGDKVALTVTRDVKDSVGNVLIASGAPAEGKIVYAKDRGKVGKPGAVTVSEFYATAVDGSKIPLTGAIDETADSRMARSIVLSVLIIPFFLFMKGKSAEVPAGTTKTLYTAHSAYVNLYQ